MSRNGRRINKKNYERQQKKLNKQQRKIETINPEDIYQERYVAFTDRLGFKQFVDVSVKDAKLRAAIHADLKFDHAAEYKRLYSDPIQSADGTTVQDADVEWTSFSDSIIISASALTGGPQKFISYLCLMSSIRQAANVFIRGGLTVGLVHHQNNVIFGPAMNRAYELESDENHAKYPRIILEPSIAKTLSFAMLITAPNQIDGVFPAFLPVRKDTDGTAYINTAGFALAMAFNEIARERICLAQGLPFQEPNPRMWRDWPKKVKFHVEYWLRTLPSNSSAYEKYDWFARYFNDAYFNNEISSPDGSAVDNPSLARRTATGNGVGYQFCDPIQIPD